MAKKIFNLDAEILGKLNLSTVPNNTGDILTFDALNQVSLRTPSQTLSDIKAASIIAYNALGTGLEEGGLLAINASTTSYDISAGSGIVVDNITDPKNPVLSNISWDAKTNISPTNILTNLVTYVGIDVNGDVIESTSPFNPTQRRIYIALGVVVHSNNVNVNVVNNQPTVAIDVSAQVQDILEFIGFKSLKGNIIEPASTNLTIKKSAGIGFKAGLNFQNLNSDPHEFSMSALDPATFRYRNSDGSEGLDITLIDPSTWDNNGVTTAVGASSKATIQRVYIFPSNQIRIQRGQEVFNNFSTAIDRAGTESFVVETNISENGLFLGSIILKENATNLSDTDQAIFITVAGVVLGVAGSTSTLQQAYDVSTIPQITTDANLGSFQLKRGSLADTDSVLDILNGADVSTFSVKGTGYIRVGHTFTSPYTISAQSNTSNTYMEILNSAGSGKGAFFGLETNDFTLYNDQQGKITFWTNPTTGVYTKSMDIDTAGNVDIPRGVLTVVDDVYDVGWNGSNAVPTKNAIYDKIESLGSGSSVWGSITGTLSAQTDLQSALDGKVDLVGDTMTGALSVEDQITTQGLNFVPVSSDLNANNFTTFIPNTDAIFIGSHSTGATNYPNEFGHVLMTRGSTTNNSLALWKEDGDNSNFQLGNYNDALTTWQWNNVWHDSNPEFTTSAALGTDVDFSSAQVFTKTLIAITTLTFSNYRIGQVKDLVITGDFTLNLPASVNIINGTYDGTVSNLIQVICTDSTTPLFWATISQPQ